MTPAAEPSDEEVAAAVVVLIAARAGSAAAAEPPALWRDRSAALRAPLLPGPCSWRASGLPR
ncbi:MAG: acyl-CoA carboxylase subunit epsilon [Actinomycetota bacterium]|nr:acyl-CoA carboxylase subunit epsilon [Actinomycetota bacterium]